MLWAGGWWPSTSWSAATASCSSPRSTTPWSSATASTRPASTSQAGWPTTSSPWPRATPSWVRHEYESGWSADGARRRRGAFAGGGCNAAENEARTAELSDAGPPEDDAPRRRTPGRRIVTATAATTIAVGDLLLEMLAIPSPTGSEWRLAGALRDRLAGAGFEAEIDPAGNVVAGWGDGSREIMLLGHLDTVPGTIPPRREAGRIFGRGSVDAKGPLAAAPAAVSRRPRGGPVRFTVIGCIDEEGASRGARQVATRPSPAPPRGGRGGARVPFRWTGSTDEGADPRGPPKVATRPSPAALIVLEPSG